MSLATTGSTDTCGATTIVRTSAERALTDSTVWLHPPPPGCSTAERLGKQVARLLYDDQVCLLGQHELQAEAAGIVAGAGAWEHCSAGSLRPS